MNARRRETTGAPPSLLAQIMYRPLEPGYAAAARRKAQGEPPRRARSVVFIAILAVLLGAITATAVFDLRTPTPDKTATRLSLERQARLLQSDVDVLEKRALTLSGEIAALEATEPNSISAKERSELETEGASVGIVPVTGSGLMVTLSDSESENPDAMVKDFDLKTVVDALWSGGAEAIAINGERLTSLSAIRNAGSAILVNLNPVTSPYRVEAIGDADALEVALTRTGASNTLKLLGDRYGITSSVVQQPSMTLPAAQQPILYYAKPTSVDSDSAGSPTATSPPANAATTFGSGG